MKKQFILFFIFFNSIVSFGQLDSVISEIIGTKPGFNSYSENPITDSLFNLHFNSIIEIASQKDLETILDSTNSIDFKYCIFRILINYPSDKISDVFFDVLMDKNGGETFSSHWCYASYMRTWETMEDTQSSQKLKEVLARELIEMDSIWFFYKHKAPHYPYDDEMGEYQFVQKRNRQYKNQKVARWILKDYFKNTIKDFGDKTYGNWCGYIGEPPKLRYELKVMLSIKDSSSIEYERNSALYYFNLWLNSNSKEIRVYGAEALIRLQNIGVVLSEQQIIKIKKLKRSRRKIKTCSGCLVDRTRIKDALSGFNLK